MCKDFPELEKDYMFKSQLGLTFVSDNPFRINQEIELMSKNKENIEKLYGLIGEDGTPFFSLPYLIENFLGLSHDDIKANKEAKEKAAKKKKDKPEEGGETT